MKRNVVWSWRKAFVNDKRLREAVKSRHGTPQIALHLLHILEYHTSDAHEGCWPSQDKLCEETDLSRACVSRHLNILADAGYVEIIKTRIRKDGWANNKYKPAWPENPYVHEEDIGAPICPPDGHTSVHEEDTVRPRQRHTYVHDKDISYPLELSNELSKIDSGMDRRPSVEADLCDESELEESYKAYTAPRSVTAGITGTWHVPGFYRD